MSYLQHLEACNRFDPERFLPLLLAGRRIGFVRRDNARLLESFPAVFRCSEDAVWTAEALARASATALTDAFGEVTDGLIRTGAVARRRNEMFAITDGWGGPLLFELDRAVVQFFGVRAYAVHLNGWRPSHAGADFWIARRAASKPSSPGKLDNMVAGGLGSGYTAWETVLKEAGEEAGVPEAIGRVAHAAGGIHYRTEMSDGMRDAVLFVYDLQVPDEFVPVNTDGEVEDFRLLSARECLRLVRETDEFKHDEATGTSRPRCAGLR